MNGVPVTRMEYSEDSRVLLVEYDPGDGTRQRLEFTGWLLISPTTPTRKGNNLHWDLGLKVTPDHTTGRLGSVDHHSAPGPVRSWYNRHGCRLGHVRVAHCCG